MSSSKATSPKLDKSATIKAYNQLSKICEVIITRLTKAEIDKYTRNNNVAADAVNTECEQTPSNSDNSQVKRRPGRPRKSVVIPPNKKNESSVIEFVDCYLNVEELNASTGVTFNLQSPSFVEDKVGNESRHNNADGKRKRKSVRFADEVETFKRIRLDKSVSNNNATKTNGSTLCFQDNNDTSESSLYYNRKKILFNKDKEDDSSKQTITNEKSSVGVGISKHMVLIPETNSIGAYQQPQAIKSVNNKTSTEELCDPIIVPLPIKSENADESSANKLVHVSNTAHCSPDDNNVTEYPEEQRQIEFSQPGHESFTEVCVSFGDGTNYNENFNKYVTVDAALMSSSNNSQRGICSNNLAVLNMYSLNYAGQTGDPVTTAPTADIEKSNGQKVSGDGDFNPVISAVSTVGELETQDTRFSSQFVSTDASGQHNQQCATGDSTNRVTDSGVNGSQVKYVVKPGTSILEQELCKAKENNKNPPLSNNDFIIIDDDDVIELSDSEEVINCDDDDDDEEMLPVICNGNNKSEEKLSTSGLELDESTRSSLISNTSEELVDLNAESGRIVVFDGINTVQLNSDEESTIKTYAKKNSLSVSDLGSPSNVVGDLITSHESGDSTTNHDELIIFDDVNTAEFNSTEDLSSVENHTSDSLLNKFLSSSDTTSVVENCVSDSLFEKLFSHNDTVYVHGESVSDKNFHFNKVTTENNVSVNVTSGDVEHSSKDVYVGKIRVKDPSNLGIQPCVQQDNTSKKDLDNKKLTSKPVVVLESTEIEQSDLLKSIRKVIWSKSGFTDEEKSVLRIYKNYFDNNADEVIKKMGQIIHLAVCDNLNYIRYSEQVKKLLTGDTIIIEKMKAESSHNVDIITHGTSFVKFLKEFVNKVNIRDMQDMVFIMLCRALDSFLRLDDANKKYFRMARDVLREMLAKVNCDKYYKLDRIVYMDTYQFLKKYNSIIRLIGRYSDFVSNIRTQFKSKLPEVVASGNVKQCTLDSFVTLKTVESQAQPVTFAKSLSMPSTQSDKSVLLDKSKQTFVKGILLLNRENMIKVSDLSIDELLRLNKHVSITPRQKYFLQCYKKYFLGTTEDKLLKLGEMLHVISCEMLCHSRKLESINTLPDCSLKISEESKIRMIYKNNLKQRGFDFIQLMKGITSKFHDHCFSPMVYTMYSRITEIFLKIDINNIKYFVTVREVVKKMFELNEYNNKDLFELLTMKEEEFVRSHNSVIHMLLVYYELVNSLKNAGSSASNNCVPEQGTTSHKASEGNIIIPLSTQAVEVPVVKKICKNSIVIV